MSTHERFYVRLVYELPGDDPEHYELPLAPGHPLTGEQLDKELRTVAPREYTGGITHPPHEEQLSRYEEPDIYGKPLRSVRYINWEALTYEDALDLRTALECILVCGPTFGWELTLGR